MSRIGEIIPVGDAAVLAVLGESLDSATVRRVWALYAALRKGLAPAVLDIVPAYGSVLVRFDPSTTALAVIMANVRGAMEAAREIETQPSRTIEVSACFTPEHGLDLADVATQTGLAPGDVIREFCMPTYRVAFLGFTAGFPYMLGLSPKLHLGRLASPRVRVPAGSVGFAAGQCGIYPRLSPGGWRILGKTAAKLFDPRREPVALFSPGDAVRFRPVASLEASDATVVA
jgi:KipI family sensor histidine kinase inhibitor